MSSFKGTKGPAEILDFVLNYATEFANDNPADQIATSTWAVTSYNASTGNLKLPNGTDDFLLPDGVSVLVLPVAGDILIDSSRTSGVNLAIARISGGVKLHSIHEIQNTVITISGQRYVRTIKVQIVNN